MNAESSRSHTIYRLQIESEDLDDDEDSVTQPTDPSTPGGVTRLSFLNLVDLAGKFIYLYLFYYNNFFLFFKIIL